MWFNRYYEKESGSLLIKGKVSIVCGARRVGKTMLIQRILKNHAGRIYAGSGDDFDLTEIISSQSKARIVGAFDYYEVVFIDEAQQIPDIGMGLKILIDNLPELTIIATGSSLFDLSNVLGAPLTGRSFMYQLFPIAMSEIASQFGKFEILSNLDNYLIYGTYPEVLNAQSPKEKVKYLTTLRNAYLFKDILLSDNIRNSSKLIDLLRLIAFQIGHVVSLNELANQLGIAKQTVGRYLHLLEKAFIIKKINGFSRNMRKEVTKSHRYYFYDNGIRNAVINNFNPLSMRNDQGMLWENYLFMERIKKQEYQSIYSNNYFWRTYDKKEIDLVEEREGQLFGYEFKLGTKKIKPPRLWIEIYPNAHWQLINRENFLDFVI